MPFRRLDVCLAMTIKELRPSGTWQWARLCISIALGDRGNSSNRGKSRISSDMADGGTNVALQNGILVRVASKADGRDQVRGGGQVRGGSLNEYSMSAGGYGSGDVVE